MEKIEFIGSNSELYQAIINNVNEFDLSKLYSKEIDFNEAIVIITQKQIIPQPVYLSHPMVGLKVLENIINGYSFKGDIKDMHAELMDAPDKYSIAVAYIEKQRHLNIFMPRQLSTSLSTNIKRFAEDIGSQSYGNTLLVNVGELFYQRFDLNRIRDEIDQVTTGIAAFPVDEIILQPTRGSATKAFVDRED